MEKKRTGDKILLGIGITFAVIFGLILLLPFLMVALLFLSVARGEANAAAPDQIMFINQSSAVVCTVSLDDTVISDKTLKSGDDIAVEWERWPVTLTVSGEEGALSRLEIIKEPYRDWEKHRWYVIAQDGPHGVVLTLSHVKKPERAATIMGERVNLDVSGGVVTLLDAPGRGIQGDGHEFMILQYGEAEAAALEAQMAAAKGWHPHEESELLNELFFNESSYCGHYICDVPRPAEGWYFFRDTYNSQHGDNDESQWAVDGRTSLPANYTAALYNRETRTLYLYDYDS